MGRREIWVARLMAALTFMMMTEASAATIVIDRSEAQTELSGVLQYLEDESRELDLESARESQGWRSADGETPSMGLTKSAYWFRITLEYDDRDPTLERVLEIAYRDLAKVYVWFITESSPRPEAIVTGSTLPLGDRPIHAATFAFPLKLVPGEPVQILIRCVSDDALIVPVVLWSPEAFHEKERAQQIFEGCYYGILLVMFFYNAFLMVSMREYAYFFYCLYIFATFFLQFIMDGGAHAYLYPDDDPDLGERMGLTRISIGLIIFALALFARDFLNLAERSPRQDKVILVAAAVGVAVIVLSPWFPYATVFGWVIAGSMAAAVVILTIGTLSLFEGYGPARFFMAAFGCFLVGALGTMGGLIGILESNFWVRHGFQIGSALEVTLLSLALADRIKHLEVARADAEREALARERAEQEAKLELEHSNQMLVQSEKLANLGVMISGLGHEIANPIGTANLGLDMLATEISELRAQLDNLFDDSPEAQQFKRMLDKRFDGLDNTCNLMSNATTRLKELSMALRAQSRDERMLTEAVDLNTVVSEAMVIARGKTSSVRVSSSLGELPPIRCFRTRVGQVVTNLISNAADALSEKKSELHGQAFHGVIEVRTETSTREEQDGVLITVSDNGTGVPAGIRDKIFEQFFTTKEAGVGTGLGLSLCAAIVLEHQGTMVVDDAPELGGARFRIWLPLDGGNRSEQGQAD